MPSFSDRMAHYTYYTARTAGTFFLHQPDELENIQATYYCNVAGELGDDMYKELCDDKDLVLEKISICQEELRLVGNLLHAYRRCVNPNYIETEKKKRLINHDFLLLKVRPGKLPVQYIRAEKVFGVDKEGSKQGIHISVHSELDRIQEIERNCLLHTIECATHVRLDALIATLKEWNPNYHARKDNCWDYARETTKLLLQACMEAVGWCSEHGRLKRELEQLEAKIFKKHFVNTCLRMVNYAKAVGRTLIR